MGSILSLSSYPEDEEDASNNEGNESNGDNNNDDGNDEHVDMTSETLAVEQQRPPPPVEWVDHFSVGVSRSQIRFRKSRLQIYALDQSQQIILQEQQQDTNKATTITVKRLFTGSLGFRVLRIAYTIASLIVFGFLIAFCCQVILFLFLNMAADTDKPVKSTNYIIGALLSIPMFLYGFSGLLSVATAFIQDVWSGSTLYRQLMGLPNLVMEAICVVIYVGIPLTTMAMALLASYDEWWHVTALVWVGCVFFFMVGFAILVVKTEITAGLELLRIRFHRRARPLPLMVLLLQAILTTERMFYSGKRRERYLVDGEGQRYQTKGSSHLYTHLTTFLPRSMFRPLDPPVRYFTPDEIREHLPFFTRSDWSLERIFCRNPNSQVAFVQQGEGALKRSQVVGSLVCVVLGCLLASLITAGFLVYMDIHAIGVFFVVFVVFWCCLLPTMVPWLRLHRMYHKPNQKYVEGLTSQSDNGNGQDETAKIETGPEENDPANNDEADEDKMVFQTSEQLRVTEPTDTTCLVSFFLFQSFFFLWPLMVLFAQGNYRIGVVFLLLCGVFAFPRLYFGPMPILQEMGPLNGIPFTSPQHDPATSARSTNSYLSRALATDETEEQALLRKRAQLSNVVGTIHNYSTIHMWMWIFGVLMIGVGVFWNAAYNQQVDGFDYKVKFEAGGSDTFAKGFYYPGQPNLPYPTCRIWKDFNILWNKGPGVMLQDMSFLAAIAFTAPNETIPLLDAWFGEDEPVVDEYEFVNEYRAQLETDTPVSFKLFSFPNHPGVGVVSIRGSESLLDWMVDIQLWMGAAFAQIVRALTPLGWLWTPVMDDLVYMINVVEDENLKKVSYYQTTTKFIQDLRAGYGGGRFTDIRVTGVSLGGGLALITGAQSETSTVAFSGPNLVLSRRTYDPPPSREAIDRFTFNWIPERDLIANLDDPGMLHQHARCRAPQNSLMGCHVRIRRIT